jgi:DNA-binding CsgD family transcriptional regulator/anti-sigma regulatory factor (Ser/Thr protein kinase)
MGLAAAGDLRGPGATAGLPAIPAAVWLADEVLRVKENGPAASGVDAAERARIVGESCDRLAAGLRGLAADAVSLLSPQAATAPDPLRQRLAEFAQRAGESLARIEQAADGPEAGTPGRALAAIAASWGSAANIAVSVDMSPAATTGEMCAALSEVLREALRNVESHAHASRVRIWLKTAGKRIRLIVADNGVGFVPPADLQRERTGAGGGLGRIAERMHRLDGSVIVRSWLGRGTCLLAHAPLPGTPGPARQPALPAVTDRIASSEAGLDGRSGLRTMLEQVPGIEIVAEGADAVHAMERAREGAYVFLVDASTRGVTIPRRGENGRAGPPPTYGLTARECEVLELIAEGLSNRQIAARLVISPKTVKNHIWNLYQRMGVRGRGQAVSRWREARQNDTTSR